MAEREVLIFEKKSNLIRQHIFHGDFLYKDRWMLNRCAHVLRILSPSDRIILFLAYLTVCLSAERLTIGHHTLMI